MVMVPILYSVTTLFTSQLGGDSGGATKEAALDSTSPTTTQTARPMNGYPHSLMGAPTA